MQALLERAIGLLAVTRDLTKQHGIIRGTKHAQEHRTKMGGYCSECGLLDEYHVAHKVPGFENFKATSPAACRPYYEAYKKHYGGALARMTDRETLEMPLPPQPRRLTLLIEDLKRRIANPQVPKGAIERLLGHNLLDE